MADPGARGAILVLAKAPVPGFAKTRLAARLGAAGAADLHALLVARTLRAALACGAERVALWCAPDRRAPFFRDLPPSPGLVLHDQPAGDLGARMLAALRHHHATSGGPAFLIGTDSPAVGPGLLAEALRRLDAGAPAVLLPAEDGGYAGIGLRTPAPEVFDGVAWGTGEVLAATRARLRGLGWPATELPPVRDVDRPEDVDWLLGSGLLTSEERVRIEAWWPGGAGPGR